MVYFHCLPGEAPLQSARAGSPVVAGVSSFGFSGTNCHVVVAEPPPALAGEGCLPHDHEADMHLLVLSANRRTSLIGLASSTLDYLGSEGAATSIASICFAMSNGRSPLAHRLAIVARTKVTQWRCDSSALLPPRLLAFLVYSRDIKKLSILAAKNRLTLTSHTRLGRLRRASARGAAHRCRHQNRRVPPPTWELEPRPS